MSQTVPVGDYAGFTYAQLLVEQANLIARRQQVSSLLGSSVNGQSFNREGTEAQLRALNNQAAELQLAMAALRPDRNQALSNNAAVTFAR